MWGLYTVISRRATLRSSGDATLLATLTGTLMLRHWPSRSGAGSHSLEASARSLLSIVYLGVIGTAVAFAAFSEGIRRIGSPGGRLHRAGPGHRRRPVGLAAGDPVTPLGIAGASLVLAGLWLIQTSARWVHRPRRAPRLRTSVRRRSVEEPADDLRQARARLGAGRHDLLVGQRLAAVAGAGVRDERHAADLEADPARGDALEHRRHPDRVGRRAPRASGPRPGSRSCGPSRPA